MGPVNTYWAQCQGCNNSSQQFYMVGPFSPPHRPGNWGPWRWRHLPKVTRQKLPESRNLFTWVFFLLHLHYAKCGLQTSETVRNAQSWPSCKTRWIKIYILTAPLCNSHVHCRLRGTGLFYPVPAPVGKALTTLGYQDSKVLLDSQKSWWWSRG